MALLKDDSKHNKRPVKKIEPLSLRTADTHQNESSNKKNGHVYAAKKRVLKGTDLNAESPIVIEKIKNLYDGDNPIHETTTEENRPSQIRTPLTYEDLQEQKVSLQREINDFKQSEEVKLKEELESLRQETISQIETEKADIFEKAKKEGFIEGKKEGLDMYQSQSKELLESINDLEQTKKEMYGQSNKAVRELAMAVAERIINKSIELDEQTILSLIEDAMMRITDKDQVIIRVSEADIAVVRQHREAVGRMIPDIKHLDIQVDHTLKSGGCIIETKLGFIDASVSTKIDSLLKAFEKCDEDEAETETSSEDTPT